jgi:transcriptional regulator with XRE-family HTH domain
MLIREARRRAHLSHRALAGRLNTSASAVVRWEQGGAEPSWQSVVAAVEACGFEIRIRLAPLQEDDRALMRERLARSPEERLDDMLAMAAFVESGRRAVFAATRS